MDVVHLSELFLFSYRKIIIFLPLPSIVLLLEDVRFWMEKALFVLPCCCSLIEALSECMLGRG